MLESEKTCSFVNYNNGWNYKGYTKYEVMWYIMFRDDIVLVVENWMELLMG